MGKRSNFPRRKMDDYQTPYAPVVPLIPHLHAEGIRRFVEPCAGEGQLVRHLESFGLECAFADDLSTGFDALCMGREWFESLGADAIVTNPPWTRELMHPLIWHFCNLVPTWLLFDADWCHTRQAAPLIRHCSSIVSVGRVKWIPDSKHTGKDNAAWHRFDRRHVTGPRFVGQQEEVAA
jgi:hypothetical protein